MVAIPPISAEVELAIAEAMSEGLFTPVGSLLEAAGSQELDQDPSPSPGWDCRDTTQWSPGMWWLLNWWTSLYPAPCIEVTAIDHGADACPPSIDETGDSDADGFPLGPVLADLGTENEHQQTPPPPIAREVIEQLVVRGDCFVDLLA